MTRIYKKINAALLLTAIGWVLAGCYENFDEAGYAPEFTIGGFAAVDEIEPSSLVGYWSFDETLADAVSGGAGTNKAATFINGFKGKAVSFDVANKAYVTFDPGSAIAGLKSFTISFWVNPTFVDANADNGIDGILGLVNLSNTTGFWGDIDWFVENGSNKDAATIKAHITSGAKDTWVEVSGYKDLFGRWTNHTLTYDAATSKFTYYINGSTAKTATSSWGGDIAFVDSGPMVFGTVQFQTIPSLTSSHGSEGWASDLTGAMDEIRIYSKALSDTDVNALVVLQGKGK